MPAVAELLCATSEEQSKNCGLAATETNPQDLAQDTLKAEKQTDPAEERDLAKEALTELFK